MLRPEAKVLPTIGRSIISAAGVMIVHRRRVTADLVASWTAGISMP
jgi:hypothetical protein